MKVLLKEGNRRCVWLKVENWEGACVHPAYLERHFITLYSNRGKVSIILLYPRLTSVASEQSGSRQLHQLPKSPEVHPARMNTSSSHYLEHRNRGSRLAHVFTECRLIITWEKWIPREGTKDRLAKASWNWEDAEEGICSCHLTRRAFPNQRSFLGNLWGMNFMEYVQSDS